MNYLSVFKNAWFVTWKNKQLWWFGLALALSGSGGILNLRPGDFDKIENNGISPETKRQAIEFFANNASWITAGISILAVICLIFLIAGIIARGGLIAAVGKISKGEICGLRDGFREGKKYFWELLFIGLAAGIFVAALAATLFIPVAFLFNLKVYIWGGFLAAGAVLILIPILVLVHFTKIYGYIYAVLGAVSFWPAIENGYLLFRKNMKASIIMSLLLMLAGIIFGIASIATLIPIAIIFLIIGLALYLVLQKIGIIIAATLGCVAILTAIFFLQSIFQTFIHASWVLFFKEIASPKIPEAVPEIVPEKSSLPSATPDPITFSEE